MIQNNIGVTKVFCKYDFCEVVFQVSFFFFCWLSDKIKQTNKFINILLVSQKQYFFVNAKFSNITFLSNIS